MARIVLFGTGQLADVVHFYLLYDSPHEVVAFTVDHEFMQSREHLGLPVVPFEEVETRYPPDGFSMGIAASYRKGNKLRAEKYFQSKRKGYQLINLVSSKATTWPGLVIGDNCFVGEGSVIQPFAEIGSNVVLTGGTLVGHHTIIKDHCFTSANVAISGCVTIEPYCFVGLNATIRDNVTIARECIIGAGAVILKDTKEKGVYVGRPAALLPTASDELSGF